MAASISSKNLKGSTELTVLADIKPGLVEIPDPMSYKTRLERLLDVLFQQRKQSVEVGGSGFVGPLEKLRSLHFVHWSIIDNGTRLLLTVAYDKPWEPYIRSIVDEAGPLLDVIFCHCKEYETSTTRHGYAHFARWVRKYQQTTNFFFADFPDLSVDDIRYQQKLRALHDSAEAFPLDNPSAEAFPLDARVTPPQPRDEPDQLLTTVLNLYRIKGYYPKRGDLNVLNPGSAAEYTDRAIFNRAVRLIAQGYTPRRLDEVAAHALPKLGKAYNDFAAWYQEVIAEPKQSAAPSTQRPDAADVQGNILIGYERMTHGCIALAKFTHVEQALGYLAECVTTEQSSATSAVKCNVSFSYNGLKNAGSSADLLEQLPLEFREGMAARAGLLGDVADHHPQFWSLPLRNRGPERGSGARVALATVDVAVLLETKIEDDSAGGCAGKQQSEDADELPPQLEQALQKLEAAGLNVLHVQPLRRYQQRRVGAQYREHFGYLDGHSQTTFSERPNLSPGPYNDQVSFGEVLLGYPNDHGDQPAPAATQPPFFNGSFLVMRKLAQKVEDFEEFVSLSAKAVDLPPPEIKALLMGRNTEGAPLALNAKERGESFTYESDLGVGGCPFQAHVRLANPRTNTQSSVHGRPMRVPRLTRRGFSYGPPLSEKTRGAERGLVFMAYVANIAEQYEVVQRWLNGGNSTGLPSSQNDPLTAPGDPNRAPFRFRSERGCVLKLPPITTPFVKLEWGLYLFAPSQQGLLHLAKNAAKMPDTLARLLKAGEPLLLSLRQQEEALLSAQHATEVDRRKAQAAVVLLWKKILEGQGEREKAAAVWAAIRVNHGGVLRTGYGVLVGAKQLALEVLTDEAHFSVREYWLRMKSSQLRMHLGMDAVPVEHAVCPVVNGVRRDEQYVSDVRDKVVDYAAESLANPHLNAIGRQEGFREAYARTRRVLATETEVLHDRILADLFVVGERVIAQLSQFWFGLPDGTLMQQGGTPLDSKAPEPGKAPEPLGDADTPHCPADFTYAAQDFFRPNPDSWTTAISNERGAAIQKASLKFVEQQLKSGQPHAFIAKLAKQGADKERITRSVVGAVDGFVAANWGSFVSTISQWVRSEELWQVQVRCEREIAELAAWAKQPGGTGVKDEQRALLDSSGLVRAVVGALTVAPVPAWLHRTVVKETKLGGVDVVPGDRVVLHLGSVSQDGRTAENAHDAELLFGGRYAARKVGDTPQHACPAQEMGMGVLLGMIVAVLECQNIRADSPLAITFDRPPERVQDSAAMARASRS